MKTLFSGRKKESSQPSNTGDENLNVPHDQVVPKRKVITDISPLDVKRAVFVRGYGEGLLMYYGVYHETGLLRAGIAFNQPIGLNNGTVLGRTYFKCPPNHGVLVRPTKVKFLSRAQVVMATSKGKLLDSAKIVALPLATPSTSPEEAQRVAEEEQKAHALEEATSPDVSCADVVRKDDSQSPLNILTTSISDIRIDCEASKHAIPALPDHYAIIQLSESKQSSSSHVQWEHASIPSIEDIPNDSTCTSGGGILIGGGGIVGTNPNNSSNADHDGADFEFDSLSISSAFSILSHSEVKRTQSDACSISSLKSIISTTSSVALEYVHVPVNFT